MGHSIMNYRKMLFTLECDVLLLLEPIEKRTQKLQKNFRSSMARMMSMSEVCFESEIVMLNISETTLLPFHHCTSALSSTFVQYGLL